jgi:type I restriction enzyme S subunit
MSLGNVVGFVRLDELFSSIEDGERALERVRKLVKRYRQSVLKAAVTGELTREWRETHAGKLESGEAVLTRILEARRKAWEESEFEKMKSKSQRPKNDDWKKNHKEPARPNTSDLPQLPDGWIWASLDQLSVRITDGTHQSPAFASSGIPFLTIQHVSPGKVQWKEITKWVTEETFLECTKSIRPTTGDVLYSAVGSYGMAVAFLGDHKFMFQRHIAHIRPVHESVDARFLEAVLNAPFPLEHAHGVARGVAQKTVTLGHLRGFPIPVPPLHEQRVILDGLATAQSRVNSFENTAVASLRLNSALRRAILKSGFSGQLVPQDPTDEPASVLLERIAAERAASPRRGGTTPVRKKKVKA